MLEEEEETCCRPFLESWLVHGALADESTAVARNLLVLGLERQLVVIGDLFSKLDVVLSGNDDLSLTIDAHDRGLVSGGGYMHVK